MEKLRIGLYGTNGHQIQGRLKDHPDGEIAAVAAWSEGAWQKLPEYEKVPRYEALEEMLAAEKLDMVCLCSPKRADQEADAIRCLEAGVHVYAEKPAVLSEEGLDRVLAAAKRCGKEYHEIADTVFFEPWWTLRQVVQSGRIGQVVQVYAQKSYPLGTTRPQDEEIDGGLIRWVGIHAMRFVEHITGLKVTDVAARETHLGNVTPASGLFTAAVLSMTLENGGVAAICMNYLNPKGFPGWGNEHVRIFGTKGMAEITDGGAKTHVYTDTDEGALDTAASDCRDFLDLLLAHLRHGTPMVLSEEEEFHPLRVVIRAKAAAVDVQNPV